MDNITHTLLGVTAAQAAIRFRKKPPTPALLAGTATWVSVVANNLPDIDALLAPLDPAPLGYLLHHRGYTHTLLGAIPQVLLILGLVAAWFRYRRISIPRKEWRWLSGIALVGIFLHIFADSWNSYGVHPLWPFDERWFYGDSVFILEPTFWMILIPPLVLATKSRRTRGTLLALGVGILALALGTHWVPKPITFAIATFALGWGYFLRRLKARAQSLATMTAFTLVLGSWFLISQIVKREVASEMQELGRKEARATDLIDIAATPAPANPGCWQIVTAEVEANGTYHARTGVFALWPNSQSAERCPRFSPGLSEETLPPSSPKLAWFSEFRAPLAELRAIRNRDCRARAFLHFSRIPAWTHDSLTDERFVRGPRFGKIRLDASLPCPSRLPAWQEPRAELWEKTGENPAETSSP